MPRSTEIVGEKTNSTGLIIHRIIAYVVLVLLVVVSLFPFYLLIINATPRQITGRYQMVS